MNEIRDLLDDTTHQPGHDWMDWLVSLVNPSKHRALTSLAANKGMRYRFATGLTVVIPEEAKLAHPKLGSGISVEELVGQTGAIRSGVYVDWLFRDLGLPVMQPLQPAGVRAVAADVGAAAHL